MSDGPSSSDRAVEAGRGALFIGFAKVFFMVSGAAQKLLLARFVGPEVYGQYTVVNNYISIVNNAVVQGTIQSVSKFTAEHDSHIQPVKRAGLVVHSVLATSLAVLLVLLAPLIADGLNAPGYVPWLRMSAAIPLLYAFYSVFVGSANGQRKFRLQATFDVTFSTLKTILLLAGAVALGRLFTPVTGAFVGFITAAALILVISAVKVGLPIGTERFPASKLVAYMAGVVAYTLLINLALNLDHLLLRRFAGEAADQLRADHLAAAYDALRTLALLPYQALLVLTFVIFPLVSRSTFVEDRETTRAYINQTLRLALLLGAAMVVVLTARPGTVLGIAYPKAAYSEGANALPVLAIGVLLLALMSICGAIINASGRPRVMVVLTIVTVAVSVGTAFVIVRTAAPGAQMLLAAATATSVGNAVGLALALIYLWRQFGAGPPPLTVARVAAAAVAAVVAARVFPSGGKMMGLVTLGVVGLVFLAALIILRELGPADTAKLKRIFGRK